jgi:hypothetical protein
VVTDQRRDRAEEEEKTQFRKPQFHAMEATPMSLTHLG